MIKLLIRSLLLLGGVAVAAVTTHNTLFTTDGTAAATQPAAGPRMQAYMRPVPVPARPAQDLAETFDGASEAHSGSSANNAGARTARPDSDMEPVPQQSTLARALAWLGLTRSSPEDDANTKSRGTSPDGVLVVDPVSPSTKSTSTAAADSECKRHNVQAQPQGVSADVDFVGVLLKGQELAGREFTGAELSDLKILVQWRNLFSNHRQRLELIAPDGSVYQSLSQPLTATDVDSPVATVVPVSGTWITRYGLYGSWCVDVFFDQDEKPVASRRVVISS